jgi:hypothetical protein
MKTLWVASMLLVSAGMLPAEPSVPPSGATGLVSRAAQARMPADPTGHWEGAIHAPDEDVAIAVDLARTGKGSLIATFGRPGTELEGFPMTDVTVAGSSVRFVLRANSGGGAFDGVLSADGASMSGTFVTAEGDYRVPFDVARKGAPRIVPPVRSGAVGRALEGTWTGTLDTGGGKRQRMVLTIANQTDGTSMGDVALPDLGGISISIGIRQRGSAVTLSMGAMGAIYSGRLSAGGTELVGVYTAEGVSLPLTFRHATQQ